MSQEPISRAAPPPASPAASPTASAPASSTASGAAALAHDTRAGLRPPTRPAWTAAPDVLRTIWTHPRATVRWLLDFQPGFLVGPLVLAAGALAALQDAESWNQLAPLGFAAAPALVGLGMLAAVVVWLVLGASLAWTGRALGGVARSAEVRTALAWGGVPMVASAPFVLLVVFARSRELALLELWGSVPVAALSIWSAVTTIKGVAEAHHFSSARAIGAVVLVGVFYTLLVMLAILALWTISPDFRAQHSEPA